LEVDLRGERVGGPWAARVREVHTPTGGARDELARGRKEARTQRHAGGDAGGVLAFFVISTTTKISRGTRGRENGPPGTFRGCERGAAKRRAYSQRLPLAARPVYSPCGSRLS